MKRFDQDRFIAEIFDDENLERARRDSLTHGVAALRRRRRMRRSVAIVAAAAAVVSMLLAIVALKQRAPPILVGDDKLVAKNTPAVKFISDQELLDLLSNRSVALFGPPGKQQLMFLDAPPSRDATRAQ